MARKEEIFNAIKNCQNDDTLAGFIKGAEWADKNPYKPEEKICPTCLLILEEKHDCRGWSFGLNRILTK